MAPASFEIANNQLRGGAQGSRSLVEKKLRKSALKQLKSLSLVTLCAGPFAPDRHPRKTIEGAKMD
jgi:hypothetical protein